VPSLLLEGTSRLAAAFAAGKGAAGTVPASVFALMKGVSKGMLMDKMKVLTIVLVLVSAAGIGVGVASFPVLGDEPPTVVEHPKPVATVPIAEPTVSTSRTPNFRVEAPSRRVARLVAEAAERHRKELAMRWLGAEMPTWREPCLIQVEIAPERGTGGATRFTFDKGKVASQHMTLQGSVENLLAHTLPHEVTHTVMAHFFGAPVPRWADEGAALLSEDEEEQQRHDRLARQILKTPDRKISLRRLFAMRDFPADVMALFAEGYSVTHFLVEQKDHRTFLAFVKQGMRDGWDKAARGHYDYRDVEALEVAWLASLRQKLAKTDDLPDQPTEPPDSRLMPPAQGPAPVTAWAAAEKEGRIVIHWPVSYYQPRTKYVRRDPSGPASPVTTYERATAYTTRDFDAREVEAFGTDGKPIEAKALLERLRTPVAVLVSSDGRLVPSFYLQVIKEGTLILVLPESKSPPPPPVVPAPTVHEVGR
jgi:hypothetical protein